VTTDPHPKEARLRAVVADLRSVAVGLSGGVDSSLLAAVCHEVLDEQALAVIADSPSLPRRELDEAVEVARAIGIGYVIVDPGEIDDPRYASNPSDRCFFCKDALFVAMSAVAGERGLAALAYGENLDDDGDHRPGRRAAREHRVRAPLREAGLRKSDVRELARQRRLPVWDKPEFACLASRIPHGTPVTAERLGQVERAEDGLAALGFRQVRVRHHGELARIEVPREQLEAVAAAADAVVEAVRGAGFAHATLDLAGYRRGGARPPVGGAGPGGLASPDRAGRGAVLPLA
jgi:pyridinium-3,5-biscarboxylic acid mononucleotide sulfurtransferase